MVTYVHRIYSESFALCLDMPPFVAVGFPSNLALVTAHGFLLKIMPLRGINKWDPLYSDLANFRINLA